MVLDLSRGMGTMLADTVMVMQSDFMCEFEDGGLTNRNVGCDLCQWKDSKRSKMRRQVIVH